MPATPIPHPTALEVLHMIPRIGDLAPDFTLPSHIDDKQVTLNHLRGKNVVLVFYPAAFTPV